jgi:hypothetical protein
MRRITEAVLVISCGAVMGVALPFSIAYMIEGLGW